MYVCVCVCVCVSVTALAASAPVYLAAVEEYCEYESAIGVTGINKVLLNNCSRLYNRREVVAKTFIIKRKQANQVPQQCQDQL